MVLLTETGDAGSDDRLVAATHEARQVGLHHHLFLSHYGSVVLCIVGLFVVGKG